MLTFVWSLCSANKLLRLWHFVSVLAYHFFGSAGNRALQGHSKISAIIHRGWQKGNPDKGTRKQNISFIYLKLINNLLFRRLDAASLAWCVPQSSSLTSRTLWAWTPCTGSSSRTSSQPGPPTRSDTWVRSYQRFSRQNKTGAWEAAVKLLALLAAFR